MSPALAAPTPLPPTNSTQQGLLATVRLLAETIGPRPPASDGERKAAALLISRLRHAGYAVQMDPFDGLTASSWTYGPLYGGAAVAGLLGRRLGGWATLLGLGAFAAFVAETLGFASVSRLGRLPRGRSQNVVARLAAAADAAGGSACRVVLVAHLDSPQAALPFHPALVGRLRELSMAGVLALATIAAGGVLRPLLRGRAADRLAGVLRLTAAGLLLPLGALLHRESAMPPVAGANSNASGVAVVLAAAETLLPLLQGLRDRPGELWILFTGCAESGQAGMQHFLATYRAELDPATTLFLNVDTVGAGLLTLVKQEGVLWPLLADPELLDTATHIALRRGVPFQTRGFHTAATDALVPLARGYRALSLMAFDDNGHLPNWHWPTDTTARLDPATLEAALTVLVPLVRRLIAPPGRRVG